MLGNIKSTAKGTIIYGLANVSIKLIGIVLIPIYTNYKYLSKEDFGVLGVVDITYQLAIIIFGLALYQSFARWYLDPEHRSSQKSMHFTVIFINTVICLVSFIFVFLLSSRISYLLFDTTKYSKLIWIMFASASVNIVSNVSMVLLRLQERALKYATISIIKLLVTLSLTILFVVYRHKGLEGIYEATLIGELTGFTIILSDIIRNSIIKLELKKFIAMMQYGLPLMLASVSSLLLNTFDRYSLNYLTDLDTVGTYTLAFRIANSIKVVVIASIQLSLVPIVFKKLGDPDIKRFIAKTMNYSALVVTLAILFFSIFSTEIVKVFASNTAYYEASVIIPILSFSMVFVMMKENVLIGLQITKSAKTMGLLIAFTALFNLGLNIFLIPRFRLYGAASATLISQITMFTLFYFVAQRKYPIPYELRNLIILIAAGAGIYFVSLISTEWLVFPRIAFKSFLIILLPVILIPLRFYEPIELQRIKEFIHKYGKLFFK